MLRTILTLVSMIALAAWAAGPQDSGPGPAPAGETVKMGGGYSPVVSIPVDDARTKSIAAALFEPEGAGPFPAVIILGGCQGVSKDVDVVKRVNADYLPQGIATLVVDSFTPRGVDNVCGNSSLVDRVTRAEDAYAAMAWLARKSNIDSKHIFLQGYSNGAMATIEAIDAKRAATHQQKFAGAIAFYPYCWSDLTKYSVKTIILIGEGDDWTPAFACQSIPDKSNVEVTVYPNALHGFARPGDSVLLGHRMAFQEFAAVDGQRRALALIRSLSK